MSENQKDIEKMINETIDIYLEKWQHADHSSLVEELEMVYRHGIKGFIHMNYDEVLNEYNEYEESRCKENA